MLSAHVKSHYYASRHQISHVWVLIGWRGGPVCNFVSGTPDEFSLQEPGGLLDHGPGSTDSVRLVPLITQTLLSARVQRQQPLHLCQVRAGLPSIR